MKTGKTKNYWLYSRGKLLSINIALETMEKLFAIGDGGHTDWCEKRSSDQGFICTRVKGHNGPHIATSEDEVCALWPQK